MVRWPLTPEGGSAGLPSFRTAFVQGPLCLRGTGHRETGTASPAFRSTPASGRWCRTDTPADCEAVRQECQPESAELKDAEAFRLSRKAVNYSPRPGTALFPLNRLPRRDYHAALLPCGGRFRSGPCPHRRGGGLPDVADRAGAVPGLRGTGKRETGTASPAFRTTPVTSHWCCPAVPDSPQCGLSGTTAGNSPN